MARPCPSRPGLGVRSCRAGVHSCRVLGPEVPEFVVRLRGFGRWCRRSFAPLSAFLAAGAFAMAFVGWFGRHTFALAVPPSNTEAVRQSNSMVVRPSNKSSGVPRTQRNAEERSLELLTTTVHCMACSSWALFGARLCRLGSAVGSRQVAPKSCRGHPGVRAVGSQRGALGDRRPVDRALGGLARDR